MSAQLSEEQEEEKEVLFSIYGSDPNFKAVGPVTFQYKVGDVGSPKTFLVELTWPEQYPEELPCINLDTFYNNHLSQDTRKKMTTAMIEEIELLLGSPMTYTLLEYCRDSMDSIIPAEYIEEEQGIENTLEDKLQTMEIKIKTKKEVLSKAAKRKQTDRLNKQGELPRGWDWVDIVKHLSKTGCGQSQ